VHRGQAETGPAADGLGREEGLEDATGHILRHTDAGVLHLDLHLLRGGDPPAGYGQRAAVRHGVARVDAQVQQHLSELDGVATDPAAGTRRHPEVDDLRQDAGDHSRFLFDEGVHLHRPCVDDLAPASGQQATGQILASGDGPLDGSPLGAVGLGERRAPAGVDLGGAGHRHEKVVEVVGDAARQLSQGLQTFGLTKPLLQGELLTMGGFEFGGTRPDLALQFVVGGPHPVPLLFQKTGEDEVVTGGALDLVPRDDAEAGGTQEKEVVADPGREAEAGDHRGDFVAHDGGGDHDERDGKSQARENEGEDDHQAQPRVVRRTRRRFRDRDHDRDPNSRQGGCGGDPPVDVGPGGGQKLRASVARAKGQTTAKRINQKAWRLSGAITQSSIANRP
jgi:hypothetical protein